MTWHKAVGGVSAALSIGLGAYGAHGLSNKPEKDQNGNFASRY